MSSLTLFSKYVFMLHHIIRNKTVQWLQSLDCSIKELITYIKIEESIFEKYKLNKGDLLFNRTNSKELVGKTALFFDEDDYTFASYLIRVVVNENVANKRFINYLFNSSILQYQKDLVSRQIIVTTHSPTVTKAMYDDCLFMVDDGKIIPKVKQEMIDALAGEFWNKHQQSTFLSSDKKIILLVEGKHDKIHIKNAFTKLKEDYTDLDFDIFSLKGEKNIAPMLRGLRDANLDNEKVYIGIFDNDKAGNESLRKGGFKKVENKNYYKLLDNEYEHHNFYAIPLPKPKDFTGECTIENMYVSSKFQEALVASVANMEGFLANKSIDEVAEEIKLKAKNILSEKSQKFEKNDFAFFESIFESIQNIYKDARIKIAVKIAQTIITNKDKVTTEEPVEQNTTPVHQEGEYEGLPPRPVTDQKEKAQEIFYFKNAKGTFNPENHSFTLLSGSEIRKGYVPSFQSFNRKKREDLINQLDTTISGNKIIIHEDRIFPKPSTAAIFVYGGSENGWTAWKNKDGKTLDELFRKGK